MAFRSTRPEREHGTRAREEIDSQTLTLSQRYASLWLEAHIFPIRHIDIKNGARPRTFVKPPVHFRNTVRQYVVLVRLSPLHYVAHLFTEFPQISGREMMAAV
jgi:hypothetical protein